ncbi:eukaryotic translation initiation factor 2 subunit 2 [Culicoides brevitarsis]|uniref:eukaryotic translation initiation factor 2 subunit 2 n=1 Tax=Culicoides brevitarsis TaxID=469753 RepID=UPI00307BE374
MTEEAIFDPSLMKKKKKKKTAFDLDAALAAESGTTETQEQEAAANEESTKDDLGDLDADLDLENFGKKKKKKKKPFINLDGDEASGSTEQKDGDGDGEQGDAEIGGAEGNEFDFGMKKKKKKKKDLNDILKDEEEADKENVEESSTTWSGSDRDYTYDELLKRVFEIILDKNPDMATGTKPKFVIKPPQVLKIGTKKTSFANFTEICKTLHRQPKHLLDFLLAELGTSGSVDGNSQLIIKGRFQPKQIENVLRRYIKEYVTCHTCRSPETILQKDTRLFFLQCETCGSRCSVASIKSGFQAVTGKRAAIRAKTA